MKLTTKLAAAALVALALVAGSPASAPAQMSITCTFNNTLDCSYTLSSGSGTEALNPWGGAEAPGPCAANVGWNYELFASGGYNNGGYLRFTHCDQDPHTTLDDAYSTGFGWGPPGSNTWPTEFFFKVRFYVEDAIVNRGSNSDGQLKWLIWNVIDDDPPARVMLHFNRGDYDAGHRLTGSSSARCDNARTKVCLSLMRNIFINSDEARIGIPLGQWVFVQGRWRHGAVGTSLVELWLNTCTFASPTSRDTKLDVSGAWNSDDSGYENGFNWGQHANTDTFLTEDWHIRMSDLSFGTSFDSRWCPPGGSGGAGSV